MIVSIDQAVQLLNSQDVVAMPTETVYGLAARIDSEAGLQKIFKIKARPFFDPLIVHVSHLKQAQSLTKWWPEVANILAKKFWPGPLTIVLPKSNAVNDLITSGLETVGIRMPRHPLALEIISKVGVPLAAPSANMFGKTSPTTAAHVESEFIKNRVGIIDGGACEVGLESTVLLIQEENPVQLSILRAGQVLKSEIISVLTQANLNFKFITLEDKSKSPGHMKHHYMPKVPFVLCKSIPRCDEHLKSAIEMAMQDLPNDLNKLVELVLSPDPTLAAREFYQKLRNLAEQGPDIIYFVMPSYVTAEPWAALLDRMTKAATLILDQELD